MADPLVQVKSVTKFGGIDVYTNPFVINDGSVTIANNCVADRPGLLGNRRGFGYYSDPISASAVGFAEYQNGLIMATSDHSLAYDANLTGTFVQYTGQYIPPTGMQFRGTVEEGNFYFPTTLGVYKLSGISSTPVWAGTPPALDLTATIVGTGGGFLSGSTQVAYQQVWSRTDANGLTVLGAPSAAVVVVNANLVNVSTLTSAGGTATVTTATAHNYVTNDQVYISGANQFQYNGTFSITVTSSTTFNYTVSGSPTSPATGTITAQIYNNVSLVFSVPAEIVAGDTWQLYRTASTASSSISPGTELQLVTSGTYTTGPTVTVTDTFADSLLQYDLYTDPLDSGPTAANYRPPYCTVTEVFQDYMFYGNTSLDYSISLNLISAANLSIGSSISFLKVSDSTSITYTAGTTQNPASQTFQLFTSGTAAQNIANTAHSLISVINQDPNGHYYAQYLSGQFGFPGQMQISQRNATVGSFYLNANNSTTGNCFSPVLPTSGSTVKSNNSARINRIYYSQQFQPESVPLVNYIDVGREDKHILRLIALRNSLFIIKEDGVFYLLGISLPFTLRQVDLSSFCLAANSIARMNNQIFMLTNQGYVQMSEGGTTMISGPITTTLNTIFPFSNLSTTCFATASETDRNYMCWVPTVSTDTVGTACWVYNIYTQKWTMWTKPATAAVCLDYNRTTYIGSGLENAVLYQRNSGTQSDYSDETLTASITANTPTTATIVYTNSIFSLGAGFGIQQSTNFAKVTNIVPTGSNTYVLTIDRPNAFTTGACSLLVPIYSTIQLPPDGQGTIGLSKVFQDVQLTFIQATVSQLTINVGVNEDGSYYSIVIDRTLNLGWGNTTWGGTTWGSPNSVVSNIPFKTMVALGSNSGELLTVGMTHNVAQEGYYLGDVSYIFQVGSDVTSVN